MGGIEARFFAALRMTACGEAVLGNGAGVGSKVSVGSPTAGAEA